MRTLKVCVNCIPQKIPIGHVGENVVEAIQFDYSAWKTTYGEGTLNMVLQRSPDTIPYAVDMTDGLYIFTSTDLKYQGAVRAQLVYNVTGNPVPVKKSDVFLLGVDVSLGDAGDIPDPWQSWLDRVLQASDQAQEAVEHYPKVENGYWYVWNVSTESWTNTGQKAQGEEGAPGVGVASTVLNADYTLTITLTDGTSYTTPSIRGATGNGIASTILNSDYTLTITFTDGTSYTTPSIRGAQGIPGQDYVITSADYDEIAGRVDTMISGERQAALDAIDDAKDDAVADVDAEGVRVIGTIPSDYTQLSNDVSSLKADFTQSKTNDLEYFPDTPTLSGPIQSADGEVGTGAYVHTDYIEVEPNTNVICHTVLPSNSICIAVYDGDKTFLSAHYQGYGTTNFIDVPVPVPKNGRYIRCTCYTYQTDVSKFYVKYNTTLKALYEDCIREGLSTIKDKADKHIGQNLYMPTRTQGTASGGSSATARKLKESEYYVGFSADGYYNSSKVTSCTVQNGNVTVQSNSGYGVMFPVPCKPNTAYAVSHVSSESTLTKLNTLVSFYDVDGHNVGYTSGQSGKTFTTPATAVWVCLIFGTTASATEAVTFSNIQIEEGSSVHAYHPYALNDGVNLYQGIGNVGGFLSIDKQGFVIPSSDSIVARNNDVLVQAQASCMYGMWNTSAQPVKKLSILVTTDIHGKGLRLADAVEYGNVMPFVDMQVNLGDTTPSYYSDSDGSWYSAIVAQSDKPFYTMLGNHDGGNGKTASQNATVSQSFNKWIAPNLGKMGMPSLTTPYYYVADTTYKVGMVFLNNYDVPDTTDGSGNYVVSRGAEVISQTQVDWLLGVLDSIPSDYTLIVFMHSFPYSSAADAGNWTQHQQGFGGNGVACYTDLIPDIINAWKTGGSLAKTYAPQISDVTESIEINHSFASRGTGTFACYIVGHTHKDLVGHSQTYTNQLIIGFITTADDRYQNGGSDLPRVQGTKSVDAITLVGVHTSRKRINLVRIGSNTSAIMQDRTMISLSYT